MRTVLTNLTPSYSYITYRTSRHQAEVNSIDDVLNSACRFKAGERTLAGWRESHICTCPNTGLIMCNNCMKAIEAVLCATVSMLKCTIRIKAVMKKYPWSKTFLISLNRSDWLKQRGWGWKWIVDIKQSSTVTISLKLSRCANWQCHTTSIQCHTDDEVCVKPEKVGWPWWGVINDTQSGLGLKLPSLSLTQWCSRQSDY